MKKMLVVMMAFAMVFAMSAATFAKDTVQVTLTSPAISKVGCEKAGSVTFGFDANSVIRTGDWWYFDLPNNVTLCKSIDYFITTGVTAKNENDFVTVLDHAQRLVAFNGAAAGIPAMAAGDTNGPLKVTEASGVTAPLTIVGQLTFRVYGVSGTQRVWIYAYGDSAAASVTVGAGTKLLISVLDGQAYQNNILLNTDTEKKTPDIWGDEEEDTINFANTKVVPHVENTLCINAELYKVSDLIFISLASLNDKFTFTGDSQIAHIALANLLKIAYCADKVARPEEGDILIGGQNACIFEYEPALGYCANFIGNRLYLQGSRTFGDPNDSYDMSVSIDTPGVYFQNTPILTGFKPADKKDCATAGGAVQNKGWTWYNEAGTKNPVFPNSSCAVPSTNRIRKVETIGGAITSIDTYDALWINLPSMVYDTSIIGNGTEVELTIVFSKYPCGVIFTDSVTIGTFVTTCATAGGTTTLMYPFLPPMDGSIPGWWGGFNIVNYGTTAGTARLTFNELDGDSATFTTSAIPVGGMWVGDLTALLSMVTPSATNAGTFGDSNFSIHVVCNFGLGGGFAFTGNGEEGTGYTAYVLGAGGWQ